jgi:cytoskeleton protein RodZ
MTQVTRLTLNEDGGLNRKRINLREISGDLDAPLETVGQDLRAARLKSGEDVGVASRALRIRKEHLEALEDDRLEALPGRTYAVGFVRSYADYLGLDPVLLVERYKAEIAGRNDTATPPVTVIDEDEHKKLPQGWWIAAVVVLLLVIYGAFKLMEKADDALSVNEPQDVAANMPVPKPVPKPVVKPQPVLTAPQPAVDVAPGLTPTSSDAALSVLKDTALLPSGAAASPPREPLPQGRVFGVQNKNARVVLRALQTVRILITPPKGSQYPWLLNEILKPGDIYQVPNIVGIKMTVSDASAVEVDLDGQVVGRIGRKAEPADGLSLDPQAIMDRYNH